MPHHTMCHVGIFAQLDTTVHMCVHNLMSYHSQQMVVFVALGSHGHTQTKQQMVPLTHKYAAEQRPVL